MNDSNIESGQSNQNSDRMSNLEKEVATLTQENRELRDLLRKLDTEDIHVHRIYKQVREKLDLEHEIKKKSDNPFFTATVSILVAGVTAFLGNASFANFIGSKIDEVENVNQKIKKDVKQVEEQIKEAQNDAVNVEEKVKEVQKEAQEVQNNVNKEVNIVKQEVKKAQNAARKAEDQVEKILREQ